MPHVAFVPFTGLRVSAPAMLEFGMSLPGLKDRGEALNELPSLGLLTLAGMLPDNWSCTYHPSASTKTLLEDICRISELCQMTREHPQRSFPPHWDPPPRIGYGEVKPDLVQTIVALQSNNPSTWFFQLYVDKMQRERGFYSFLLQLEDEELNQFVDMVSKYENPNIFANSIRNRIDLWLLDTQIPETKREILERLRALSSPKDVIDPLSIAPT